MKRASIPFAIAVVSLAVANAAPAAAAMPAAPAAELVETVLSEHGSGSVVQVDGRTSLHARCRRWFRIARTGPRSSGYRKHAASLYRRHCLRKSVRPPKRRFDVMRPDVRRRVRRGLR